MTEKATANQTAKILPFPKRERRELSELSDEEFFQRFGPPLKALIDELNNFRDAE